MLLMIDRDKLDNAGCCILVTGHSKTKDNIELHIQLLGTEEELAAMAAAILVRLESMKILPSVYKNIENVEIKNIISTKLSAVAPSSKTVS